MTLETIELNRAISWEFKNENMRFSLLIAFSYFTNFLDKVSSTKSNKIITVRSIVTQNQSFHYLIFYDPKFSKIMSVGYGALVMTIEPVVPPKN